jgi:hypothetical protein
VFADIRHDALDRPARSEVLVPYAHFGFQLAGALAFSRAMSRFLYGIRPGDPAALAVTMSVLAGVAAVACLIPARRATQVDPMAAIHAE